MKTVTTTITCDVCKVETNAQTKNIQVIFTTDQTEGRNTKPYLSVETFDMCEKCFERRIKGESIYGSGAQGHNTYYFK